MMKKTTLDNPDPDSLEEVTVNGRQVLRYKKGKAPTVKPRYSTTTLTGETPAPAGTPAPKPKE